MNGIPQSRLFTCVCVFLSMLLCLPFAYAAPSPIEMETEDEQRVKWDLTADSLTTLSNNEVLEARGNVHLRRGTDYLKADFARYYIGTKWVYLQGNVIVRMGKDEIKAETAEFDLRSKVGWLKNGEIFMDGPHAYISGQRIDKHWGDVYTFQNAKISTCDGDSPAWSLTAEEAVVELDDYARLTKTSFQVKDQPVVFSPYFVFPTKTSRQTGFLRPEYGRSNKKGFYYNQPFFWAINDSSDMTINERYMEKRGFMHGIEYRTTPNSTTTGWIRGDWLYDKERVLNDTEGPYRDGLVRTNYQRYWLRGMLDSRLNEPDWRLKMDLDYVSDQDYLSEFKGGLGGFGQSRSQLFSLFNRDLREKNEKRESGLLLSKDWERVTLAFSGKYTQDPSLGHGNRLHSTDTTVQQLPQFDAFLHKGRIFPEFALEADMSAQAGYKYRRSGTKGMRYEVAPRLTLPMTSKYGALIASSTLRHTMYSTEEAAHNNIKGYRGPKETDKDRTVPEYSLAGSTEFARVYQLDATPQATNSTVGTSRYTALRHSIQPRAELAYRQYKNQEHTPYYDDEDRLEPRTELVYSLTNLVTRKREMVVMEKNAQGKLEPTIKEDYVDLIRLDVSQGYNHREETRSEKRDTYPRRPFGDVKTELTAYYDSYFWLRTKNDWSPYMNTFTRHESGVGTTQAGYGSLYVGYDQRRKVYEYNRERHDNLRYIRLDTTLDWFYPWTFSASYRHELTRPSNEEKEFTLAYNHQCFTIMGQALIEPQEETYQIMFAFSGLGDW